MATSPEMNRLLDAEEVSELLGIPAVLIRRMARNGELPSIRIGRRLRFDQSVLRDWIDARSQPAA
jgi:excisionase family DNA binding protein